MDRPALGPRDAAADRRVARGQLLAVDHDPLALIGAERDRTAMVSPGFARSTARWTLRKGRSGVPGPVSFPFVATTSVVGAADASVTGNAVISTVPTAAAVQNALFTCMGSPASA
ncbi:hypothetical protein ACIP2Y_10625 [Streptomyces sviceus]|uniref:hypothetical protein n=1 Tax=Streptomyces sviceus TaxID=285530 RepID=UPI003828A38B